MKVRVVFYDPIDQVYDCITQKGEEIVVDPFLNSIMERDPDPLSILGKWFKLKNKSKWSEFDGETYFYPNGFEWYQLKDKTPIVDCEKFFD